MVERPDPDKYAAAVLGFQWVLAMVGLSEVATVWPDRSLVTDDELNQLSDQWHRANAWS
jgi:hypothetical protein